MAILDFADRFNKRNILRSILYLQISKKKYFNKLRYNFLKEIIFKSLSNGSTCGSGTEDAVRGISELL